MSISISSERVSPGTAALFNFDSTVLSYVVGIYGWYLIYDQSDHQTQQIAMSIQMSAKGNTVKAQPSAILSGQGHTFDPSKSWVGMCCIAIVGDKTPDSSLFTATNIPNGQQSGWFPAPSSTLAVNQSMVTGWSLAYGIGHHVRDFKTQSGSVQNGNQVAITATALMDDNSGNQAQNPTLDGGLVCSASNNVLCYDTVRYEYGVSPSTTLSANMNQTISNAAVLVQGLSLTYGSNTDHDIKAIGGGVGGWSVAGSTVTISGAFAEMSDNSGHHQAKGSFVDLLVLGIPAS